MQEVKVSIPLIGSNLFKCVGMKSAILALCHIVSIPLIGSNLFKLNLIMNDELLDALKFQSP